MADETAQEIQDNDSLIDVGTQEPAGDAAAPEQAKDPVVGKPDWLAEDLWDTEKNSLKSDAALKKIQDAEKHEKMAKDLRDKLARRGLPPEKAEDYKINIEDKPWKDAVQLPEDVMSKVKATAHKLGIPQSQFGPLAEAYLEAIATVAQGPVSEEDKAAAAEVEKERQASEVAKLGANGSEVVRAVSGMVRDLKAQGVLNDSGVEAIKELARTAAGVEVLNAFRELIGGERMPMMDVDPEVMGGVTHGQIQDLMDSPAYQRGDALAVEKFDKMVEQTIKAGNPFRYKI